MGNPEDANERFDELWERAGKHRLVLGEDDGGVEIRIDADLSPLEVLKRMQALSEQGHADGLLGTAAKDALHGAVDEWRAALDKPVPAKLRERWQSLLGHGHGRA